MPDNGTNRRSPSPAHAARAPAALPPRESGRAARCSAMQPAGPTSGWTMTARSAPRLERICRPDADDAPAPAAGLGAWTPREPTPSGDGGSDRRAVDPTPDSGYAAGGVVRHAALPLPCVGGRVSHYPQDSCCGRLTGRPPAHDRLASRSPVCGKAAAPRCLLVSMRLGAPGIACRGHPALLLSCRADSRHARGKCRPGRALSAAAQRS
jgi:hypothetical protein